MITKHKVAQRSPEWFELRVGKVTASMAHRLLAGDRKPQQNSFSTFASTRGLILEDEAIELYERIKNVEVERVGFMTNSKYPNCGYSPDGLLPDRIIEVKCFSEARHLADLDLPTLAQAHFGMMIAEKKLCDVVLYNPELEPGKALIIVAIESKPKIVDNFKQKIKELV